MEQGCLPPYPPLEKIDLDAAVAEANRCLHCQDPPCEGNCPGKVRVRSFLRKVKFGDLDGAAAVLYSDNPLAGVCGVVCHASGQCQARCTRSLLDVPVRIAAVQRFVAEWALANRPPVFPIAPAGDQAVAVVGGGPAGLSAAVHLAREGYRVELSERSRECGGVLAHGIPDFRLPRELVRAEIEAIEQSGVAFTCEAEVEPRELLDRYDAVFLGVGWARSKSLGVPGEELKGVIPAGDFLRRVASGTPPDIRDAGVIIIGGGNTSVDAARAAARGGAREVTLLYRRSEVEMPAFSEEIERAKTDGVLLRTLTAPVAFGGPGRVAWVECAPMVLGEPDESGRRRPVPAGESTFRLPAAWVVVGIGEDAEDEVLAAFELQARGGEVPADGEGRTSTPRLYVGGDILATGKTVVQAVQDGRRAAQAIHRDLSGNPEAELLRSEFDPERWAESAGIDLGVEFLGVRHRNPFLLAAAPPSDELGMIRRAFQAGWAGAVLKTTSVEGTPVPLKYPMITGTPYGDRKLVSMGNIDLISEYHIDEIERRIGALKEEFPDRVVVGSMMGATQDDWTGLARRLRKAGADIIECSFSCPQGTLGSKPGFMLGQDAKLSETVTGWVKDGAGDVPVVIKITPQVTDISEVAEAVKRGGADAICASNTIPSLTGIDPETFEPVPSLGGLSSYSGLSGPAILPITLRNIAEVARTGIPITGTGGPENWRDSVAMMSLGVTTVQFCTAVMHYGFDLIDDLLSGLYFYLHRQGYRSPAEIVGRGLGSIAGHDDLPYERPVVSRIDQDLCIHCGRCHIACRDGGHEAIEWDPTDRRAETDPEKCVGCGLCLLVCPVTGCISLEEKGEEP